MPLFKQSFKSFEKGSTTDERGLKLIASYVTWLEIHENVTTVDGSSSSKSLENFRSKLSPTRNFLKQNSKDADDAEKTMLTSEVSSSQRTGDQRTLREIYRERFSWNGYCSQYQSKIERRGLNSIVFCVSSRSVFHIPRLSLTLTSIN